MSEALRVLKPGGHALVWALPRTSHWTGMALENAGFEIRDTIHHVFSTGFPKSQNIGKAIDKAAGAEREVVGIKTFADGTSQRATARAGINSEQKGQAYETAPATEDAKKWEGYGSGLKPAHEVWFLCRKPLSEKTIVENVLRWSTGALNIDRSRVVTDNELNENGRLSKTERIGVGSDSKLQGLQKENTHVEELSEKSKKPSDVRQDLQSKINNGENELSLEGRENETSGRLHFSQQDQHNGTQGCNGKTSGQEIDRERSSASLESQKGRQQSGEFGGNKSGAPHNEVPQQEKQKNWEAGASIGRWPSNFVHDGSEEVLARFPETETHAGTDKQGHPGGTFFGGMQKFGQGQKRIAGKGSAARFFKSLPPDPFVYMAKPSTRERNAGLEGMTNGHPTLKGQALMRYFITLITPPGGTVIDFFMGSGSTGVAAKSLGFDFIGIELEPEYFEIAKARIEATQPFVEAKQKPQKEILKEQQSLPL